MFRKEEIPQGSTDCRKSEEETAVSPVSLEHDKAFEDIVVPSCSLDRDDISLAILMTQFEENFPPSCLEIRETED
ncbi:hypothetical protein GOP47_0030790 [Adiantum capillus-veneris]|nr:hypothetical protein GOP47_0030790 [Adiantum capillus-veneris]